jgi:phosphoenolpyruvate-protein kinase (PTS system EI component)
LRVSARRIEADTSAKLGAIFEAHEVMLQDPGLREEIRKLVREELISAAHALSRVLPPPGTQVS